MPSPLPTTMPLIDLPEDEEMAAAVACIDAWAARELASDGPLVAAERQEVTDRTASFQWYLRFKGEEKDYITVWFTLKQRTLWHEAQFMPAPEENKEEVFAYLMRRNIAAVRHGVRARARGRRVSGGPGAGAPDRRRRARPHRRGVGRLHRRPLPDGHDPGPPLDLPAPAPPGLGRRAREGRYPPAGGR